MKTEEETTTVRARWGDTYRRHVDMKMRLSRLGQGLVGEVVERLLWFGRVSLGGHNKHVRIG